VVYILLVANLCISSFNWLLKTQTQSRCNTGNIIFDSIETLNVRNRLEYSKAKDSPGGKSW